MGEFAAAKISTTAASIPNGVESCYGERRRYSLNQPDGSTSRLTLICLTSVYAS